MFRTAVVDLLTDSAEKNISAKLWARHFLTWVDYDKSFSRIFKSGFGPDVVETVTLILIQPEYQCLFINYFITIILYVLSYQTIWQNDTFSISLAG
jgi:hypothetical protein